MTLTDEHIAEIAEWLDCGMICYFHQPTGMIEYHPDPLDPYFEEEMWEDIIDKVESDWNNYILFNKMDSNQGFEVMEDFADSMTDTRFKEQIIYRLSNRKPFQNFKILVESSEYRQDWFDFKKNAYIDFVKRQLKG